MAAPLRASCTSGTSRSRFVSYRCLVNYTLKGACGGVCLARVNDANTGFIAEPALTGRTSAPLAEASATWQNSWQNTFHFITRAGKLMSGRAGPAVPIQATYLM